MPAVVLTGGSRGIGGAVLSALLSETDSDVCVLGLHAPQLGERDQGRVIFTEVDLADAPAAESALRSVVRSRSDIWAGVSNAGAGTFGPIEGMHLEQWTRMFNLNVTTPFLLMRECISQMRAASFGRLVVISSDADDTGFKFASAYCASKHALRGLCDAIRLELVGTNVSITAISPGRVDTFFNGKTPGDRPRSLSADDVARQVMHVLRQTDRCSIESIRLRSSLE